MQIIYEDEKPRWPMGGRGWAGGVWRLGRLVFGVGIVGLVYQPMEVLGISVSGTNVVLLAWDPSPSAHATGYRVYQGGGRGSYTGSTVVGNVTACVVSGLPSGVTYFFAVTAYDAGGLESDFSNEVSYSAPGPSPPVEVSVGSNRQATVAVTGRVGHTYEILATQTVATWQVIGTVTLGDSNSASFTDASAAGFPARFYLARDTAPDPSDPVIDLSPAPSPGG